MSAPSALPPMSQNASDSAFFPTGTEFKTVKKRRKRRGRRSGGQNNNVHLVTDAIGGRKKKGNRSLFPSEDDINKRAEFRTKIGAEREEGTIDPSALRPHPSRGGRTYSTEMKIAMIHIMIMGCHSPNN